ncbi:hypothetical protein ACHEKH_004037, partial [Salmonella bongori]|nr:hypothetical protein [Salmonella bongori]ECE6548416.1 hypothetical protein [Salmonella bongori]ECG1194624.1 hypothetical protein [Salmonella bongori]ECI3520006.1 hypothetical protein [Salmonella bongori]
HQTKQKALSEDRAFCFASGLSMKVLLKRTTQAGTGFECCAAMAMLWRAGRASINCLTSDK